MNYIYNKIVSNGKIILVIESFVEWKSHFYKLPNILWYAIDGIKVSSNFVSSFYILSMLHDDAKIGVTSMLATDDGIYFGHQHYPFTLTSSTWTQKMTTRSVTNIKKCR